MATVLGTTQTQTSGTTVVLTPESGTASGDRMVAMVASDVGATLTAPDGTWTVIPGSAGGPLGSRGFYKDLSGAPDATYTFGAGTGGFEYFGTLTTLRLGAGETWGTVTDIAAQNEGTPTALSTGNFTMPATPNVLLCAWSADDSVSISTPPTGMTLEESVVGGSFELATYSQVNVTAGTTSKSLTWSGATQIHVVGAAMAVTVAAGPTIDTQPTAQTAIIAGPAADASVDFVVAATTSGGSLVYDWELEDSVGAGTYTNAASGSGLTISGATSATCTVVASATTKSGCRMRCNVTDDNDTTTTNAVAVAILAGDTLVQPTGTTNTSGQFAVDGSITSDYSNGATGRRVRITGTCEGVVIGTTTVWVQA